MAKSIQKVESLKLRKKGKSLDEISSRVGVSKSTVSRWCHDVSLTPANQARLRNRQIKGSTLGRLKGATTQRNKRVREEKDYLKEGIRELSKLQKSEFFTAGIALYWGEGLKTGGVAGIVNSDPRVMLFMIRWFKAFCGIGDNDFVCRVNINSIHEGRIAEVENYWMKKTGFPAKQFTKTSLLKSKNRKQYENFNKHYGTLSIRIRKSTKIQRRILGWIEGLSRGGVAQPVRAQDS